jgi:hypothetical protein
LAHPHVVLVVVMVVVHFVMVPMVTVVRAVVVFVGVWLVVFVFIPVCMTKARQTLHSFGERKKTINDYLYIYYRIAVKER